MSATQNGRVERIRKRNSPKLFLNTGTANHSIEQVAPLQGTLKVVVNLPTVIEQRSDLAVEVILMLETTASYQ
jgi:hypothetical protein